MSVFKRLSNVARGKMKELGKTLESGLPDTRLDLEPDPGTPRRPGARDHASPPPTTHDKRQMLERLHEEGLLTDEEFETKLAALDAPATIRPKKRHL